MTVVMVELVMALETDVWLGASCTCAGIGGGGSGGGIGGNDAAEDIVFAY
jgi:hypothetical protein